MKPLQSQAIAALLATVVGAGCSRQEFLADASLAEYVGRSACVRCHEAETRAWTGSHHDLAMQEATAQTVLGDFEDATFSHRGVTSKFYQQGDKFMVRTDGPTGELEEYQIAYTFGVHPLQQYLIAFPGGRQQALGICWDARPKEQGGQRWFHLYPDEPIAHDDPLHWTGRNQNWNLMCASCHSTNLVKGYDVQSDAYHTQWSEIDVSCEACHGPASQHVAWAEAGAERTQDHKEMGLLFDLQNRSVWSFAQGATTATRQGAAPVAAQMQNCAACHSRRSSMSEDYAEHGNFFDGHRLSLLEPHLYHPDGQIKDEVFVYGSFLQSRMYHKGVTCTDCHEPHSLQLLAQGNALCIRCHQASTYDSPDHHHHESGSLAAACVECHMPAQDYMVVDPRRDHSIRIPRPDLSASLGTPNACGNCHQDRTPAWAAQAIVGWKGSDYQPARHYGETLHAGRQALPGAAAQLAQLSRDPEIPGIARATALSLLAAAPSADALRVITVTIKDEDPLLRFAALAALEAMPPQLRDQHAAPLLRDPVRLVRAEAARVLAAVPKAGWEETKRSDFHRALVV